MELDLFDFSVRQLSMMMMMMKIIILNCVKKIHLPDTFDPSVIIVNTVL